MEQEIKKSLEAFARQTGVELKGDLESVSHYIAEQSALLSQALASNASPQDYDDAVLAARDNVALTLGIQLGRRANAIDQRTVGFVHGLISALVAAI